MTGVPGIAGAEDTPSTVLITPFTIKAPEDLAYLSEALADMLSSRMSIYEGLTIIDEPDVAAAIAKLGISYIDREAARKLGIEAGADRVVMGIFSKSADGITLESMIIDPYDIAPSETVTVRQQSLKGLMQGRHRPGGEYQLQDQGADGNCFHRSAGESSHRRRRHSVSTSH